MSATKLFGYGLLQGMSGVLLFLFSIVTGGAEQMFESVETYRGGGFAVAPKNGGLVLAAYSAETTFSVRSVSLTNMETSGQNDSFLLKFDSNSNLVWKAGFQGTGEDRIIALDCDSFGNTFAVSFHKAAAFNIGNVYLTRTNADEYGIVLSKLATNGVVLWTRILDSNFTHFDVCITINRDGDCILSSEASFGSWLTVAKYSSQGDLIWLKKDGINAGGYLFQGRKIAVDNQGNIFIAITYSGPVLLAGTSLPGPSGLRDVALVKYDPQGNGLWAKVVSAGGAPMGLTVCADENGNSFWAGMAEATLAFGTNTINVDTNLGSTFLAKFDSEGNFSWGTSFSGVTNPWPTAMSMDCETNIYIGGRSLESGAYGYVAKFDCGGQLQWQKIIKRIPGIETRDFGVYSIALDNTGDSYVTGDYTGSMKFDDLVVDFPLGPFDRDYSYGFLAKIPAEGPRLYLHQAGNQTTLSWFTNQPGFFLESTPSLSLTNWSSASATVVSGMFVSTNPISGTQFFRLRK